MPTPHKHAALIKQWADGATIEVLRENYGWILATNPEWLTIEQYRVKPEPTILHGFIDPTTLHPTDMPFTVFRPYQATFKDIPCTLTFFPDA